MTLVCAMSAVGGADALAAQVPVTVTIESFHEVQNPEASLLQGCCGDYFATVSIDGQPEQTSETIDNNGDISPHWHFTRMVDDAKTSVPVTIQITDEDSLVDPPDVIDIDPKDDQVQLDLSFNPQTATWSGDTPANVGFSQGDGDHEHYPALEGGEAGAVLFDISRSPDGDLDDDGIPDGVERFGLRNAAGQRAADMPALGADPCRKTIALQIDWMADATHNHRPKDAAVADAKAAMDAAPPAAVSNCPYAGFPKKSSGVNLVVDRVNQIAEQEVFTLDDLKRQRDDNNGLDPARRSYFHYVVFAHDHTKDSSSSGLCCRDDRDFLVTLGHWKNQVGRVRDQSGSILHELGHALGLGHGGASAVNFKPNYRSVMNYAFDPTGIPEPGGTLNVDTDEDGKPDASFRLDYSRSKLPTLDEEALVESVGIQGGLGRTKFWDPTFTMREGSAFAALDYNWNGFFTEVLRQDVNNDYCVGPGKDEILQTMPTGDDLVQGKEITPGANFSCTSGAAADDVQNTATGTYVLGELEGYDDWKNIQYRAAMSVNAGGASVTHGPDITHEQAEQIDHETFALYTPDLTLTKAVDSADAVGGDVLGYTVTARNAGTGAAAAVKILDTLPGATQVQRGVGELAAGASHDERFSYTVPCTTADGASIVNHATVSGTNLLENPEIDTTNNAASATTTAHVPVLTLGQTAAATVNAGEAITYRLTYANTGSGPATSVVMTQTLPAGVYYSTALDLGAGPRPTAVTRNADATTTLTWAIGTVAGNSATSTIEFTARPTLLATAGTTFVGKAALSFKNANDCTYAPVAASRTTTISAVTPSRNPLTQGYFKNHPDQWASETLARIQATDQRFDTAPADGRLSAAEVPATFNAVGSPSGTLRSQLLATLFNLAQRRIDAGTRIASMTATARGLRTVAEAVRFAEKALDAPADSARLSDATRVLDEINSNRAEVY